KFLNFLFEYNYIPVFRINKDALVQPEVKPIIVFRDAHLKKIFEGLSDKNDNFKTLIYMLYYTGLRPSDVINVKVDDIDFHNNTLRYYSMKTKENFIVPLHKDMLTILKARCEQVITGRIFEYGEVKNMSKAFYRYVDDL